MTRTVTVIRGLRGHVAPCSCVDCVNERVVAINASLDPAVFTGDAPAPDLTEAQREDVRAWAQRDIRPPAVVIRSPWHGAPPEWPRNRAERRRGMR